ncbi:chaplin [Streptomyces sp. GMY02]|uniref:chaplin n=1 Tax=Streptomyces sp. GMY02 TaxID=1333528 RepID=UPI001C2BC384|nr:chaplin [Streptomyces sp. GMY02]QXE33171.1 chaplin [Streptomyces sp. GMY02]
MSRIAKATAVLIGTGAMLAAGAGVATADADAEAAVVGSPGVLSGNAIQVPVSIPVNVCGNTVDLVGILNPAFGNHCANVSIEKKHHGKKHHGKMHEEKHHGKMHHEEKRHEEKHHGGEHHGGEHHEEHGGYGG